MCAQKILDVGPADVPGMEFMTRSTVSGYQVKGYSLLAFCSAQDSIKIIFLWNDGDPILRTRRPDGDLKILQLIPRSAFLGDFPRHFIDEYTHWLDLDSHEIEFRPAGLPWMSGPFNWRLYLHEPGIYPRATFRKPSRGSSPMQLVDIRSSTFSAVSSMLSPLESPENIIATHTGAQSLEVSLPRLHLLFFVNSTGELESRSMPNYVVDKNQSLGTLFGLKNKLILCPRPNNSEASSEKSLLPRRVIIPQGNISYCTIGDFASVFINTDAEEQVRWYEYTIDTDLGCLTSNTSLRSKLYQCYLHALTSHCLPDPLLGHTGTEEALYILRSAACRSFQRLDSHDAELLQLISNLTPKRVYYPHYLQSMATVKWNDLPMLSQHHDFWGTASNILDHARALEALYDQPTTFDSQYRDLLLLNRAASRNKLYYPSDLQISGPPSSLDDVEYISRDVLNCKTDEEVAYQTSWSIWNFQPSLHHRLRKVWYVMESWDSVGSASSIQPGKVSLRYSRYWLECDAARDWFVIYDLCRHVVNEEGPRSVKIKLSFCLSAAALAYSKSNSRFLDIIPFFIAVSLDERFHFLNPPPLADAFYTLSDGVYPRHSNLKNLISQSAIPIDSIPGDLIKTEKEILKNARKRRKPLRKMEKYESIIEEKSSHVAKSVLYHWNRNDNSLDYESVDKSVDFHEFTLWFNKSKCLRLIEKHIRSILKNIELKGYVLQLECILEHYADVTIPTTPPYKISPQFVTSCTKAPSYSILNALLSRPNVPTPRAEMPFLDDSIPFASPTATDTTMTTGTLAPVGPDSLKVLVEELLHSRQPLLELYGNELNKSHRELMGNGSCQSARGALPSQELLRFYHNKCSRVKDKIFSEISAALAPSQNVENVIAIAGLWPRITTRSLLRQLAQDRIGTLPEEWKAMITRYAVCFLKYQQSQRLLDLAATQKSEEILREIETMHGDALAESTPDWLLVQVRPQCYRRSI